MRTSHDSGAVPTPVVKITLDVWVHDQEKLTAYAKKRHREAWGEDWEPEDLTEAVYEALIASNENPAPLDYGIEIKDSECWVAWP